VIVRADPAGLGAAFYTTRDRFKTLVLEKFYPGGQINHTDRTENYPGFENISGPDLIEKMMGQVSSVFDFAHKLLLVELENASKKNAKR